MLFVTKDNFFSLAAKYLSLKFLLQVFRQISWLLLETLILLKFWITALEHPLNRI